MDYNRENGKIISIIIPIFNSEKYISRCLESIIKQTYSNIEIILVNDGSKDNSLLICKEYEAKDSRITIINKENAGVSAARNDGIKYANGDLIQFIDSDDCIIDNMCETMISAMTRDNSDIVICGSWNIRGQLITPCYGINKTIENINEIREEFSRLYEKGLINPPWNKLYRKEIIKSYFNEAISLGEDLIFNLQNITNAKRISFIDNCLYFYYSGIENSLTSNKYNSDRMKIAIELYKITNKFCDEHEIKEEYRQSVYNALINTFIGHIEQLVKNKHINIKQKKALIKEFINNKSIEKCSRRYSVNVKWWKIINYMIRVKANIMIYLLFKLKLTIKSIQHRLNI